MALGILKSIKPDLIKMYFVDISMNTNFPLLHKVKHPNLKFIVNRNDLKTEFTKISETARYLSSSCLGIDFNNLQEYNKNAEFKEPYNVLFVSGFPKEFREEDIDMLYLFVTEAAKSGVYVIMSIDKNHFPNITEYNRDRFEKLFLITQKMITVDCTTENVKLKNLNIPVII